MNRIEFPYLDYWACMEMYSSAHLYSGLFFSLFIIMASNTGPSRTTNSIILWIRNSRFLWRKRNVSKQGLCLQSQRKHVSFRLQHETPNYSDLSSSKLQVEHNSNCQSMHYYIFKMLNILKGESMGHRWLHTGESPNPEEKQFYLTIKYLGITVTDQFSF